MANTRISNLTASASNLASTDLAPVVQTAGVGPVKMTGLQLAGGLLGSTTFNGSTVTTSSPVLNLTQTWNTGAVTFTGLKFNATDTASASGSLLLDLQVGGTSQFKVRKDGYFITNGAGMQIGTAFTVQYTSAQVTVSSGFRLGWGSSDATSSQDLSLTRAAAATLQLGAADAAAPVAQFFKVQGVVAGTTNTAGANFTIQGSQGTGTGAGGSIIFQVAPAGSSGTAQNAYSTALTIDSTRTATFAAGATFAAAVQGATNIGATNNLFAGAAFNNAAVLIGSSYGGIASVSTGFVSWTSSTTDPSGTRDLILARDAANTLALRNGGTSGSPVPQTFNIYNYWASASDYERGFIRYTSSVLTIGHEALGSGTASRNISFRTNGAQAAFIDGAGGLYGQVSIGVTSNFILRAPSTGVVTLYNWDANNFDRLQFGGTTSSFPALKRSSASLICRLADDSANAAFEALSLKTSAPAGGTSGTWKVGVYNATAPSATGYVEVDIGGTLYKLLAST